MISIQQTPLSIDGEVLFTIPKFILQNQDKVGLVAANGCGKTTFLHALISKKLPHNATIAFCPQKTPLDWLDQSWNERVLEAPDLFDFQKFYDLTDLFHIPVDRPLHTLSGGQQRLGLICFVVCQQAMHYFFDEPTNHLDLPTIAWLEGYLKKNCPSYLVISHDRAFLESITEGYWAIHEKLLRYYPGKFEDYLEKRQLEEQSLAHQRQKQEVMLSQEERYRERGVTARRKRNQKRVQRLHELRDILSQSHRTAAMNLQNMAAGGKGARPQQLIRFAQYRPALISRTKGVQHLTTLERVLTREDRIALVGPNGCGKTTFLQAIKNELEGIEYCRPLVIESIDQHRLLDPNKTLLQHLTEDPHQITLQTAQGQQIIHPASYLEQFALSRDEFSIPYAKLSGGQQIKLCLALALLKNPDVLILDEPTNDLDADSLEELADWLSQYQGLVLIVSHDRYFIDQCATEVWYWTTRGLEVHAGGVDLEMLKRLENHSLAPKKKDTDKSSASTTKSSILVKKPDAKEIAKAEDLIEKIEKDLAAITIKIAESYETNAAPFAIKKLTEQQQDLEHRLEKAMSYWESLTQ